LDLNDRTPPGPPLTFTVTLTGTQQVEVAWTEPTDPDLVSRRVLACLGKASPCDVSSASPFGETDAAPGAQRSVTFTAPSGWTCLWVQFRDRVGNLSAPYPSDGQPDVTNCVRVG
jgi:hypothetical protein